MNIDNNLDFYVDIIVRDKAGIVNDFRVDSDVCYEVGSVDGEGVE